MSLYGSGDLKSLSQLYTEDCKIMPTGSDVLEGRASTLPLFVGLRMRAEAILSSSAASCLLVYPTFTPLPAQSVLALFPGPQ